MVKQIEIKEIELNGKNPYDFTSYNESGIYQVKEGDANYYFVQIVDHIVYQVPKYLIDNYEKKIKEIPAAIEEKSNLISEDLLLKAIAIQNKPDLVLSMIKKSEKL